jgi:hypothetical protein
MALAAKQQSDHHDPAQLSSSIQTKEGSIMAVQRMSKTDFPLSFGVFKPVGHVVVGVDTNLSAAGLREALLEIGFDADDITCLAPDEMEKRLHALLPGVSSLAGFGSELESMKHYEELASQGYGWVVVYAPDAYAQGLVAQVAREHGAKLANKYNRLTLEELL